MKYKRCRNKPHCKTDAEIDKYIKGFQVDTWAIYHKIDFHNYDLQPSYKVMNIFGSTLLGTTVKTGILSTQQMQIVRHNFEMEDDLIHFGQKTSRGFFFQLSNHYNRPSIYEYDQEVLGLSEMWLSAEELVHKRKMFDIIALLGTLGGVTGIIRLAFGVIFFRISETSFLLQAAKRLFLARTKDDNFFQEQHPKKNKLWYLEEPNVPEDYTASERSEVKKHRFIRPKISDKCCF